MNSRMSAMAMDPMFFEGGLPVEAIETIAKDCLLPQVLGDEIYMKRKRGSSTKSSRSSSLATQQQIVESDGSASHNSKNSLSNHSGSVKLKSILRKEPIPDNGDDTTSKVVSHVALGTSQLNRKRVSFKHIHVREFERIIGDNPSCSSGAPVAIGWAYDKERTMLIDEYEAARPPRKQLPQLVLSRQDREEILVEWGALFNEIIDSIRANVKAKNQRRRTVSSLDRYDRFEEYMENASRRLKRTLLLQKTVRKQAEEMADQSTRFSNVTYIDRPPQQPQQQRTIDVAPRQPPRAPESPRPPLVTDFDADDNMHDHVDLNSEHDHLDAAMEEQASRMMMIHGDNGPAFLTPPVEFDPMDDLSFAYYDQFVPVQFIGGTGDQPLQYCQQPIQFQSIPPDSQQYYLLQQQLQYQQMQVLQQQEFQYPRDAVSSVMEDLTYDGDDTDGLESLGRSCWGDAGMDAPGTRRRMAAVIISEDGQYDADDGWDNGFTIQPPPHSNSIISSWE